MMVPPLVRFVSIMLCRSNSDRYLRTRFSDQFHDFASLRIDVNRCPLLMSMIPPLYSTVLLLWFAIAINSHHALRLSYGWPSSNSGLSNMLRQSNTYPFFLLFVIWFTTQQLHYSFSRFCLGAELKSYTVPSTDCFQCLEQCFTGNGIW